MHSKTLWRLFALHGCDEHALHSLCAPAHRCSDRRPTAAPAEPTAAPVEPPAAPVEPTAAPVEPTAAPVEPTAAPAETGGLQIPDIQEGKFNVAMVLIGPHDDGGWSQAHYEGLEYVQAERCRTSTLPISRTCQKAPTPNRSSAAWHARAST